MATAGFFAKHIEGSTDNACCGFCRKNLDGWEEDDDPWEEHCSHSPTCPLVNLGETINRELTFTLGSWPHKGTISAEAMATAGFFYWPKMEDPTDDDTAICVQCGLALDGWEPSDDPRHEHSRRRPTCPILVTGKVQRPAHFELLLGSKPTEAAIREWIVPVKLPKPIPVVSEEALVMPGTIKNRKAPKTTEVIDPIPSTNCKLSMSFAKSILETKPLATPVKNPELSKREASGLKVRPAATLATPKLTAKHLTLQAPQDIETMAEQPTASARKVSKPHIAATSTKDAGAGIPVNAPVNKVPVPKKPVETPKAKEQPQSVIMRSSTRQAKAKALSSLQSTPSKPKQDAPQPKADVAHVSIAPIRLDRPAAPSFDAPLPKAVRMSPPKFKMPPPKTKPVTVVQKEIVLVEAQPSILDSAVKTRRSRRASSIAPLPVDSVMATPLAKRTRKAPPVKPTIDPDVERRARLKVALDKLPEQLKPSPEDLSSTLGDFLHTLVDRKMIAFDEKVRDFQTQLAELV